MCRPGGRASHIYITSVAKFSESRLTLRQCFAEDVFEAKRRCNGVSWWMDCAVSGRENKARKQSGYDHWNRPKTVLGVWLAMLSVWNASCRCDCSAVTLADCSSMSASTNRPTPLLTLSIITLLNSSCMSTCCWVEPTAAMPSVTAPIRSVSAPPKRCNTRSGRGRKR